MYIITTEHQPQMRLNIPDLGARADLIWPQDDFNHTLRTPISTLQGRAWTAGHVCRPRQDGQSGLKHDRLNDGVLGQATRISQICRINPPFSNTQTTELLQLGFMDKFWLCTLAGADDLHKRSIAFGVEMQIQLPRPG